MRRFPLLSTLILAAMLGCVSIPAIVAQHFASAPSLPPSARMPDSAQAAPTLQDASPKDEAETAEPSAAAADALSARGRYLAAIRMYERIQPTTANVQNRMGVASERMLMFDQAQRCFEAALRLDPKLGEAWNNLGTVFHNRGDLSRAERMYRRAIKLRPESADAFQNLGALYYGRRKFKKGDEMYREAMRIDPGVMERTAQRGIQAASTTKNSAEMHYHLACTFAQTGSKRLALDYLRKSIVEGFHDRNRILHEASFADLRTSEPFMKMVDDLRNN